MSWNPVKGLRDWATGGSNSNAYNMAAATMMQGQKAAEQTLEDAKKIKTKSAEDVMKEGQAAAGVASANKAGEAKKAAMGAATMGGANRLQSALAGASAAGKAASEGFSDTANANAQMTAQKDLAEKQAQVELAKQNAANQTATANAQAQGIINQAEGAANRRAGLMQAGIGAIGGLFSDENCKKFGKKHTYIPKEERR